ncbi:MAG: 50S ribosomal protein L24 [Candidatus Delongbacteria bacterium]|nr:50S ribosomal protein L24 [Candidatus Delongbacteria bacterium]MCG2761080.1 50S ribosomal protein L24 [Candidatus Delongbacteria bacterium]
MKIIKDDKVKVIAGNNKGKIGKVLKVIVDKNKVIVEGINLVKKHQKPNQTNQQGGIIEKEAPIHVSNVMIVCSNCNEAVRISKKRTEDGTVERICKSCNKAV